MSAEYDGNIKLGVSVTTDAKSVVTELGALRKQIVDMFSSVDKSLAGGSGSFSNLEKTLSKIATDVGDITKVLKGLPTKDVAKVVDAVKEVGTVAQESGDAVKSAFNFDVETASTEELYQKLKQLREEADAIREQKLAEGFTPTQANNSKEVRIRQNQMSSITDELRNNRGLSPTDDYKPAINYEGDLGNMQVQALEQSLNQAQTALATLQAELSNMSEFDDGFEEKTDRVNELTSAIIQLNEQLAFEKLRISGADGSGGHYKQPDAKSYPAHLDGYDSGAVAHDKIYAEQGKEAADAFTEQYNKTLTSEGKEAAEQFAKSFQDATKNVTPDSGNMIAYYKQKLAELQSKMKDFDKLKITMSDEEVGKTLVRIQKLKDEIALLTADAVEVHLGVSGDGALRDLLHDADALSAKLKQFRKDGTGFGSMEEAQSASAQLAEFTQEINDYFRSLDPAQQKLVEFTQSLAEMQSLKSKRDSGQALTADEASRYVSASETVREYTSDIASLIQIRDALNSNLAQYTKTGLGFENMEDAQVARANLEQLNQTIAEHYKTLEPAQQKLAEYQQALSTMSTIKAGSAKNMTAEDRAQFEAASATVERYKNDLSSLIQVRNALKANVGQFEKTGTGMNTEEYKHAKVLLAEVSQQCDVLAGKADKASNAMAKLSKVDKAFSRIRSAIAGAVKSVSKMVRSFGTLGKTGTTASNNIGKGFKRSLVNMLKFTLGVRGLFTLFRRLRSTAIESLQTIASQFPEVNKQFSETKTLLTEMKGSFGTMIQPLATAVLPVLNQVISALTQAIQLVGKFFAALSGQGVVYKATANQQDFAESLEGAGGAAKDAVKSLMGFDELNVLQDKGGGGGSDLTYEEEIIDPESAISKFADMLREAWQTGDFFDVGHYLGEMMRDGLNQIDKWINTSGKTLARKVGKSFASLINGIVAVPGLADSVGRTVANAINMAMEGLHQFFTTTNWLNVGKFVADTIMAFFNNIDWELLGQTTGSYIMMFVDSLYGFVTNIDFNTIGQHIATSINNIFDVMSQVDETGLNGWQKIGQTLSESITGLLDTVLAFIQTVDWGQIGTSIGQFIESIDFGQIVWDVTVLIANLVAAIAEGIANWAETEPISAALATMLGVAMIGVKVAPAITTAVGFFGKLGEVFQIVSAGAGTLSEAIQFVFGPGSTFAGIGMTVGGAITAISSFFSMLQNGFSWLKEILMVIGIAITAVGAIILGAPVAVTAAIAGIVAAVATLVVLVKEHWTEICAWFEETWAAIKEGWNEFWTAVSDKFEEIWTGLCDWWKSTWETIKSDWDAFWEELGNFLNTFWTNLCAWFEETWNSLKDKWNTFWDDVKQTVIDIWTAIQTAISDKLTAIKDNFTAIWDNIKTTVTDTVTNIKTSVSTTIDTLKSNISTALNNIKSTFVGVWDGIKSSVTNIVNGMSDTINGVIDGIKNTVSGVANTVKSTINTVIGALNGLSFTVPEWSPVMGGKTFGFNIPYLAQGAVIPPNQEFMAVLGDQKHGTNIEAPLDTIKQAVAEELSEYIDAMMAGFDAVVNAIDNKDMSVSIGDSAIGKAAERYNRRQQLVRGSG